MVDIVDNDSDHDHLLLIFLIQSFIMISGALELLAYR
jgi:hypothetical protein